MMTRQEAIKKIIHILETEEESKEAFRLAYDYNVELEEIWSDDGEEIIGMCVEDEYIYFQEI